MLHWSDHEAAVEFQSAIDKKRALELLIASGHFYEIELCLKDQLSSDGLQVPVPPHIVKEIGSFLSGLERLGERTHEELLEHLKGERALSTSLSHGESYIEELAYRLEAIAKELRSYRASGTVGDEEISHWVWTELREIVSNSSGNTYWNRLRRMREANKKGNGVRLIHKILWFFRGLKLQWKFGKSRFLYGDLERYDTELRHAAGTVAHLFCGHCGTVLDDNAIRTSKSQSFPPHVVKDWRGNTLLLKSSYVTLSLNRVCHMCNETLREAFTSRLGGTVSVIYF